MIDKNIYNIDWAKLRQFLLPSFLRKLVQLAWQKAVLKPLEWLHDKKQDWRESMRYKMNHNGQVIYLEKMLNEHFNIVGYDKDDHQATKQIFIGLGEQLPDNFIFTLPELQPVTIYTAAENQPPYYLYTFAEYAVFYADFVIWIPVALPYEEAEVKALVDYYINTRFYKIKTY